MKRMFGTAGIRGVINHEITPQLALGIGIAYGDWIAARGGDKLSAAVAHDTRYGADMLARAAASGLSSAGLAVQFYGCVSTGVFSLNLVRGGQRGGVLVTGSHMPPDRTGIICLLDDGAYAPVEITDDIEARYHALATRTRRVRPEDVGHIDEAFHPYEAYVADVVKQVDARRMRERKLKIVVDPANGTASYIAKELYEWFGCEVEMMNFDPSPVPGRASEPRANTVGEARKRVVEVGADAGICFDVDADRVLFITHEGEPVSEDTVGAIFAREELRKGDVCVTPVNSSGLIELACRDAGARLEYCEVGQPPTAKAIKALGAAFAYEESGKYYFPRHYLWADGPFVGVKMLELMTRRERRLAEIVADFPRFHQVKHTVHVEDARKEAAVKAAEELLSTRLTDGRARDITVDGFKRVYGDNSWLLIRKSGTEPLIRVYSDAPTAERAQELVKAGTELLQEAIVRAGRPEKS
jgi:phosphomannomutase/phosphoglucomutase